MQSNPTRLNLTLKAPYDEVRLWQVMRQTAGDSSKARLLVVFIDAKKQGDSKIYNAVKRMGDLKLGIQTVNVVIGNFHSPDSRRPARPLSATFYTKIAQKINVKLGGRNQAMLEDSRVANLIKTTNTVVLGIDVTHPYPDSGANTPSVAAVAASIDALLAQFPVDLRLQYESRQEMVGPLRQMMVSRLAIWRVPPWKGKAGQPCTLPQNILVFRDGVSESQHSQVLETELQAILHACAQHYPEWATKAKYPKITIIVVTKRISQRFYPRDAADGDRRGNVLPGTVVDRSITEGSRWDFFLIPHVALQGTVKPAHFTVLLDEICRSHVERLTAQGQPTWTNAVDMVEDIIHTLCYMFQRSTRAVSLVPPVYYADLAWQRARRYLASHFDATSQGQGQTPPRPTQRDIALHPFIRNTMF